MRYQSSEDRLNPITPAGADDTTLGGYPAVHGRAPGFEGSDGEPYTVAIETEQSGGAGAAWAGYLVFVRWARTGSAVMGHLDSEDLVHGASEKEVRSALDALPLARAKEILDRTLEQRARESAEWGE